MFLGIKPKLFTKGREVIDALLHMFLVEPEALGPNWIFWSNKEPKGFPWEKSDVGNKLVLEVLFDSIQLSWLNNSEITSKVEIVSDCILVVMIETIDSKFLSKPKVLFFN